ncbi:MAG: hypothetical protein AMXMBFR64_60050 [Myxococcales bacterium]
MSAVGVALAGSGLLLLAGLLALVAPTRVTAGLSILGGAVVALAGLGVLFGAPGSVAEVPWAVPGGALSFALDPLAALFLVPIGLVSALGALYATHYWSEASHPTSHRAVRVGFGALAAAMTVVVLARSGVAFLAAWEVMALSAFALVATDHHREEARQAALVYLIATHVSTLLLWLLFAAIYQETGTFGFAPLPSGSTAVLALGLIAFGVKAGVMPGHVWLPGAHAVAPTHVSALLSGVLLKVGVYGIVRVATLGDAPVEFGGLVLALGVASAVFGVAFALGQHDLKRLLAWHSIENVGIILMGVGLALIGRSLGRPEWVVLGIAGGLLHVWNHAIFKSLLFYAAGAVVHATGTRAIDRLGGLARTMPRTAALFVVGAVAIAGLPPLNGFASELMVYLGLFRTAAPGGVVLVAITAPLLALVGALAVACFVKVTGAVFLGEPRTEHAETAHEAPAAMLAPMVVLAALCVGIGLLPALLAPALDRVAATLGGPALPPLASLVPFWPLSVAGAVLIIGVALLTWRQARALRAAPRTGTWDCGYAVPTPRMQYTASSFSDGLVGLLAVALRPRTHRPAISGLHPPATRFETHVDDTVLERLILPAFRRTGAALGRLRALQSGRVQLYVLTIFLAAFLLLASTLPLDAILETLWAR